MTNENLRMQMLSGIITEGEYKTKLEKKASLNESMIGGIVGVGAINQIPSRAKADYEMAFEHFLGERYEVKPNRERDDIKDLEEDDSPNDMDQQIANLEEGDDDLFTAKRFYKRTDNPRINILSHMGTINDIVMDMLETDLVKGYGPDERDDIYREYMKFVNAVQNLVK